MIRNVLQLAEILTALYCLAALYGQKMKFDIYAVVLIIIDLFLFTGINEYGFPVYLMAFSYIGLFTYGMLHYRMSINVTLINCFLTSAICSGLQMIFYLPIFYLFISPNGLKLKYNLMINVGCLLVVIFLGRKLRFKELSEFFVRRNKILISILVFIIVSLSGRIYQMGKSGIVSNENYIQMIFFLVLFFITVNEWQKSKAEAEKEKAQLEMNKMYYDAYDELLSLVRERQHDIKNHLNAILGMIYTTNNYEELSRKQTEYCHCVMDKNENAKILLSTENPLIVGFLYRKIQEIEEKKIEVEYEINLKERIIDIPEYEMVEILGVLIDNAIEALENKPKEMKKIRIGIEGERQALQLFVANISESLDMSEIEKFFKQGYSSKGVGRGIGLYKLKKMVNKKNGEIIVSNEEYEDVNYLKFLICIRKKKAGDL